MNNNLIEIVENEKLKKYFLSLGEQIDKLYKENICYPDKENIFKAFDLLENELKVVILGQDPYHNPNEAQGLAFSTPKEIKNPPSMVNILKCIEIDLGKPSKCLDGDLTYWSKQGVLLLNDVLTVTKNKPNSHKKIGWEIFTENIIKEISLKYENVVFILWGSYAQKKEKIIDKNKHLILKSAHPSPLSAYRGFFENNHFSKTNEYLKSKNKEIIDW